MHGRRNLIDHEYEIELDGKTIATVSRKWFGIKENVWSRDASQDDALLLAVTVCITP